MLPKSEVIEVPQRVANREHKIRYIRSKKHNDELLRIWRNESTYGTNPVKGSLQDKCMDQNLVNEFGYNPSAVQCFKTWESGIDKVDWQLTQYEKRGLTTREARLRLYSNGGYGW